MEPLRVLGFPCHGPPGLQTMEGGRHPLQELRLGAFVKAPSSRKSSGFRELPKVLALGIHTLRDMDIDVEIDIDVDVWLSSGISHIYPTPELEFPKRFKPYSLMKGFWQL